MLRLMDSALQAELGGSTVRAVQCGWFRPWPTAVSLGGEWCTVLGEKKAQYGSAQHHNCELC